MAILSEQRTDFAGDFLGFTFNDYHSSVFGITRVSSSNRYDNNLLPTILDKTILTPGGDGTYYFGSYYTLKLFTLQIAFDSISEKLLRRLSEVFGDKGIHDLIFDESPYKIYSVKCTGQPQLKYICFDLYFEEDHDGTIINEVHRVYKGEGTLLFTAYYPFARSRFHTLNEKFEIITKDLDGMITQYNNSVKELSEMQKNKYIPELDGFTDDNVKLWNYKNFIQDIGPHDDVVWYNRIEGANTTKNLILLINEIKKTYLLSFKSSWNMSNLIYTTDDNDNPYKLFIINIAYPFIIETEENGIVTSKKYKKILSLQLNFSNNNFTYNNGNVTYQDEGIGTSWITTQMSKFLKSILNFTFINNIDQNNNIYVKFIFDSDDEKAEKDINEALVFMKNQWSTYFKSGPNVGNNIQLTIELTEAEYLIFNYQNLVTNSNSESQKEYGFGPTLYDVKYWYQVKAPNEWRELSTSNNIIYSTTLYNNGINDEYYLLFKITSTYDSNSKITSISPLSLRFGLNNNYIKIEIPEWEISSNELIEYLKLDKKTNLLIGCNKEKQEMPKSIFNNFIQEGTFKDMINGNNFVEVVYYEKDSTEGLAQEFYYNELYY